MKDESTNKLASLLGRLNAMTPTERQAYDLGFECGKNGPNETNCHFGIFRRPELTKAWEQGSKDAEATNA